MGGREDSRSQTRSRGPEGVSQLFARGVHPSLRSLLLDRADGSRLGRMRRVGYQRIRAALAKAVRSSYTRSVGMKRGTGGRNERLAMDGRGAGTRYRGDPSGEMRGRGGKGARFCI